MQKSKNLKNFSKLFLGSSLGQLLALGLYSYIARLYSPEEFSKFGFVASLTLLLSIFATGQFHNAALNPNDPDEAHKLIGISARSSIFLSVLAFFIFLVFFPHLILVGPYLLMYSLLEVMRMSFVKDQKYNESALVNFSFRLLANLFKLLPFLVVLKADGLAWSEMLALAVILFFGIFKKAINFSFDWKLIKKYISFPSFHAASLAINMILADFPILFWSWKYSTTEIGYFVIGQKILLVPAQVISQSVQNSHIHDLKTSADPSKVFLKLSLVMVSLGLLGHFVFNFLGFKFIDIFLGEKWSEGFAVFSILSLLFVSRFISVTNQVAFALRNKSSLMMMIKTLQFVILMLTSYLFKMSFKEGIYLYIGLEIFIEILLMILGTMALKMRIVSNVDKH